MGENRYSTMMCSSRFQSNNDTPPSSPQKGPIVYASVAEMKRKKNKMGTLRMGKPCATPCVETDLKRFHSTPDLVTGISQSNASIFAQASGFKGHRSQDDMYSLHSSMQRLNLPPPNHPPPPPPIGQVVKVDVSRKSEYESTVQLQKQLQAKALNSNTADVFGSEVRSSFKPATNAKLYACPQTLRNVAYRTGENTSSTSEQNSQTTVGLRQFPQFMNVFAGSAKNRYANEHNLYSFRENAKVFQYHVYRETSEFTTIFRFTWIVFPIYWKIMLSLFLAIPIHESWFIFEFDRTIFECLPDKLVFFWVIFWRKCFI